MGSLGDEESRTDKSSRMNSLSVDLTQQIDRQYDSGDAVGEMGADDAYLVEDPFETQMVDLIGETQLVDVEEETQLVDLEEETQLVDVEEDTQLVDLEEETQLADLACETQLVDLAVETQFVDLAGETQVIDDLDCVKDMRIEFLNNIDTTKKMDMCETQVVAQDEFDNIDDSDSADLEDTMDHPPPKQGVSACRTPSDAFMDAEHHSGSVSRGFTSVRAASIRASGLAARSRVANGNLCTSSHVKTSIERKRCEQDNSYLVGSLLESGRQFWNKNNENSEELKNSNKCKAGSTAMRKLFSEDDIAEFGRQSDDDVDHMDDMPELPTSGNCLAGLSYVDSQEPGELSQAHALEVVDKFLDLNAMEVEEGFGMRIRNVEKSHVGSGAKGSLNLAKSSIFKSTTGERGIYDWDSAREDDGGGDFFHKKKELFFDKGGTEPRKAKNGLLGNNGNKKGKYTKNKLGGMAYSDPGLLPKVGAKGKSLNRFDQNVVKNLDEQLNRVSDHGLAETGTSNDDLDMGNVGLDTQMAAEAMENLCFEVQLDENNNNVPNKGARGRANGTTRKRNRSAPSEEELAAKIPYPTRAGVTKQAKQKKRLSIDSSNESSLSPEQSKKFGKKHDSMLGVAKQKKPDGMKSTGRRSAAMGHLKEQLDFTTPVAKRTRKCMELNRPTAATYSSDTTGEINDLTSSHVPRKKRTVARPKNAKIVTIEQLKRIGLAALNQSNKTSVGTLDALNIDAVGNGQGKRSRQETSAVGHEVGNGQGKRSRQEILAVGHEVDTRCSGKFTRPRVAQKSDNEKSTEGPKTNGRLQASPNEKCGTPTSACRTPPATCVIPVNDASPICMGDEYHKQSCRRSLSKLSLIREINNLVAASPGSYSDMKELRKRKDITQIKVLFSQHLDEDVVKQQKKILSRLGGAVVLSMSEATHFVADEFVRTRNMLEAIACGKPVVTHLWLGSCGQANCLIDEKNYILRDAKKEKEFGFSLPVSLSRACQHPLLQGQKVFITPNTKPGKDILANLVKAVDGLPIERLGRSVLNDEKLPDDLLILSCEEDYDDCVPLLEKGGTVYSSELLLNGIVKQKLEYDRHRLFTNHVKRTRSTIWVKKKKTNQYLPVTKCR